MYNANALLTIIIVVIHSLGRTYGHIELELVHNISIMKLVVVVYNLLMTRS